MMGIRMMISKKRHARKRAPEIMLTVLQLDTQLVVLSNKSLMVGWVRLNSQGSSIRRTEMYIVTRLKSSSAETETKGGSCGYRYRLSDGYRQPCAEDTGSTPKRVLVLNLAQLQPSSGVGRQEGGWVRRCPLMLPLQARFSAAELDVCWLMNVAAGRELACTLPHTQANWSRSSKKRVGRKTETLSAHREKVGRLSQKRLSLCTSSHDDAGQPKKPGRAGETLARAG